MTHPPTYLGAPWREGMPPGVYEEHAPAAVPRDVRMDVAAFVGLTERGPVATPVVVESWKEFRTHFGSAGGGRLLPQSVYLFFANGGRRCVVVRAVNYDAARTANWRLVGLKTLGGVYVRLFARNPGAWGNGLSTTLGFHLQPLGTGAFSLPEEEGLEPDDELLIGGSPLPVGTLIRLVAKDGRNGTPEEAYRFVEGSWRIENGRTALRFDRSIDGVFRTPGVLNAASEVRADLDVVLDSEPVESWTNAALHPAHPRFLIGLIRRRAPCERYMKQGAFAAGNPDADLAHVRGVDAVASPDAAWLESNLIDEALLDAGPGRGGSSLIRPLYFQWPEPLFPTVALFEGEHRVTCGPDESDEDNRGDEGAEGTARRHFFESPRLPLPGFGYDQRVEVDHRLYGFADQPAPLQSIDAYDARNPSQPVSLVHLPDLVHPRQHREFTEIGAGESEQTELRFAGCAPRVSEDKSKQYSLYPKLAITRDPDEISSCQREFVDRCEQSSDRVAVLDLPPGLTPQEILQWRRDLASQRAALYAPYVQCLPAEDPGAPLITVPPGGVICGVIARKELLAGIHAAPANERIHEISGLYDKDLRLPDPAFLHEARINAIRSTARGFELLGSRTTSMDLAWTHLSVRRLVDYLERQLIIDNQWAVFEPNDRLLWNRLRQRCERRLRALFDAGAFSGRTEQDAYFVRCDGQTNTVAVRDSGQVVALIGVAPASPAEFIVFRLVHQSDGTAGVEELRG